MRVEKMIEEMMALGDVWFASMEEIAAHIDKVTASGEYQPRVDHLPYYAKLPTPDPIPSVMKR
jgi:hypothetical protein